MSHPNIDGMVIGGIAGSGGWYRAPGAPEARQVVKGGACGGWYDGTRGLWQREENGVDRAVLVDVLTSEVQDIGRGFSFGCAAAGHWATLLQGGDFPLDTDAGLHFNHRNLIGCSFEGDIFVTTDWSGIGLHCYAAGATMIPDPDDVAAAAAENRPVKTIPPPPLWSLPDVQPCRLEGSPQLCFIDATHGVYRNYRTSRWHGYGVPDPVTLPGLFPYSMKLFSWRGEYYISYDCGDDFGWQFVVHKLLDPSQGWIVATGLTFNTNARLQRDGVTLLCSWGTNAGEAGDQGLQTFPLDLTSAMMPLNGLRIPTSLPDYPTPKRWFVYFAVPEDGHDYVDTLDPALHAGDDSLPWGPALALDGLVAWRIGILRANALGLDVISGATDIESVDPAHRKGVLAAADSAEADPLPAGVRIAAAKSRALGLPCFVLCDGPDWAAGDPGNVPAGAYRMVECYRGIYKQGNGTWLSEPIDAFEARCRKNLTYATRELTPGVRERCGIVIQMDDSSGTRPEADILSALMVVDKLLREDFPIDVVKVFSIGRTSADRVVGGLTAHPRFWPLLNAMHQASAGALELRALPANDPPHDSPANIPAVKPMAGSLADEDARLHADLQQGIKRLGGTA